MGGERKRICRLCLKAAGRNFKIIEDITREIFDVLLLNVNLSISDEPVMCENCAENVQKYFDFKSSCMLAEDTIFPFTSCKFNGLVDLQKVYSSLSKNIIPEDYNVCRFCMRCVRKSRSTSLDVIRETKDLAEEMFAKCLPEMDLRVVKEPIICMNCMETLDDYFSFMMKCLDIEEKIDGYSKTEGLSSKGLIHLSDVVQFLIRNLLQSDIESSLISIIKMEGSFLKNGEKEEVQVKERKVTKIEEQELIIKDERAEIDIQETVTSGSFDVEEHLSQATTESEFRHASGMTYECKLCKFQTKHRAGLNNHMRFHEENLGKNKIDVHSSQQNMNYKRNLDGGIFKGKTCSFQAQFVDSLQNNIDDKSGFYQCEMCPYQTMIKRNLTIHMLTHKPSEDKMYKCALCTYQANRKYSLKEHSLIHKKPSEVTMYKCAMCTFQTKHKGCIRSHMLVHKKSSEITMYKCKICSHQTIRKSALNKHLKIHQDASEIVRYKCTECEYEAKNKHHLRNHMCHSEVIVYKCEACAFRTEERVQINKHMKVHIKT